MSTELTNLRNNLEEVNSKNEELSQVLDVTKSENSLLQNSLINLKKVNLLNKIIIQKFKNS